MPVRYIINVILGGPWQTVIIRSPFSGTYIRHFRSIVIAFRILYSEMDHLRFFERSYVVISPPSGNIF